MFSDDYRNCYCQLLFRLCGGRSSRDVVVTASEISYFVGSLFLCYMCGVKIGRVVRLFRELGNGA